MNPYIQFSMWKGVLRAIVHELLRWRYLLPKSIQTRVFKIPSGYAASTRAYCDAHGYPAKLVFSGEISRRSLPDTPEAAVHWKFIEELEHHHPDVFCAWIPGGYVLGAGGAVLSGDRTLLWDISQQFGHKKPDQHDVFTHYVINPRIKTDPRTLAVISTLAERTYFHWMTDSLPRFHILEKAQALREVDGFIVSAMGLPAARESLAILSIPRSKIVEAGYWTHLKAKTLIVPSLPGITGNPAPWVCRFLRDLVLPRAELLPPMNSSRIYIVRRERRRIVNESQLQPVLDQHGFLRIRPDRLSLLQQARLFSQADVILSPHGGALTNLVFCREGAKIIELFSPNYVNVCFWSLANQVGLRYSYLEGEGEKPEPGIDPHRVAEDIIIDPRRLNRWLADWL